MPKTADVLRDAGHAWLVHPPTTIPTDRRAGDRRKIDRIRGDGGGGCGGGSGLIDAAEGTCGQLSQLTKVKATAETNAHGPVKVEGSGCAARPA